MVEEAGMTSSNEKILFTEDADHSGCVETSRITINTHTSLLNIADDDEDDEDEEELFHNSTFVVIDGAGERPPTPTHPLCRPCFKTNNNAITPKHCILDRMTESFMESFCFSQSNDHLNVDIPDMQITPSSSAESENYQLAVQSDLFTILDCSTRPSLPEMQFLWNGLFCNPSWLLKRTASPPPKRPQHRTYRQRALKVRRLREERGDILRSSPISVLQTRSFDINMLRQHDVDKKVGTEPILTVQDNELGYDSDPGEVSFVDPSSSFLHDISTTIMEDAACNETSFHKTDVSELVQESFNINWNLKLHPSDGGHPIVVRAWLEKGTIIHQEPYMLEPCLMWKRPKESKPRRLRLLNICRIVPLPTRSPRFPYARPNRCWTIRTAEDEETFTLEAPSDENAKSAMARWKHCIARFAMLAVMEDVRAIQREFFHKAPTTSMLVPDYEDLDDEDS